jgi:hypothetical protein
MTGTVYFSREPAVYDVGKDGIAVRECDDGISHAMAIRVLRLEYHRMGVALAVWDNQRAEVVSIRQPAADKAKAPRPRRRP